MTDQNDKVGYILLTNNKAKCEDIILIQHSPECARGYGQDEA